MKLIFNKQWLVLYTIIIVVASCRKFVEIPNPSTRVVYDQVFNNEENAIAAIKGVYHQMINSGGFASGGSGSLTLIGGISSDELVPGLFITGGNEFYQNDLTTGNSLVLNTWSSAYNIIYQANNILKGIENNGKISDSTKMQLKGESKFIRAYSLFYLVNTFGPVPLILTTDYNENALAFRNSVTEVYDQIITDLKDAELLLGEDYLSFENKAYPIEIAERVRPNKFAVSAFLARVYLYNKNWSEAENIATEVIDRTGMYILKNNLNEVFLKNSTEAIWQLHPIGKASTEEAGMFIPAGYPWFAYLTEDLMQSFESHDKRRVNWIDSLTAEQTFYYPYKFRDNSIEGEPSEYSMMLRLAEQYLIRAESRAQLDNISGANSAESDINIIRGRAGLADISGLNKEQMLSAILHERRIELFSEWGHRWFDLIRTGNADSILGSLKPTWQVDDALFPIPQSEINKAPNLSQNKGY